MASRWIVVLCSLFFITPSLANEVGNLRDQCATAEAAKAGSVDRDHKAYAAAAGCIGFLNGYISGHEWTTVMWAKRDFGESFTVKDWNNRKLFCIPDGTDYFALVRVYLEWTDAHPNEWGAPAAAGLERAFKQRFPCT